MNTNRVLLALTLALTVGACAPVSTYTDAEAPKALKLDSATTRLDVRFIPGTAVLVSVDAARLRQLAASGAIDPADRIAVAAAGPPRLASQRIAAISSVLLHYGAVVVAETPFHAPPDRAVIALTRTLVTLPPCPNWSKPPASDFGNQPSSNFGCATVTNFGMMVANPTDLASGLPAGPMAGQPAAAAVNRYLNDKVSPLPAASGATPFSSAASSATGSTPSTGSP
jgi:pilus assembly protein CpaD